MSGGGGGWGGGWGDWILPGLVALTLAVGLARGVDLYGEFVRGAKRGMRVGVSLLPYLIGIYAALGVARQTGALEGMARWAAPLLGRLGFPPELLPLALVRPFSHAASLGIIAGIFAEHGPDSPIGLAAGVMLGSSETTFYVLTVYLGAVGLRRAGRALPLCLFGDLVGIAASLWAARAFF